jgi:hypothetical protein
VFLVQWRINIKEILSMWMSTSGYHAGTGMQSLTFGAKKKKAETKPPMQQAETPPVEATASNKTSNTLSEEAVTRLASTIPPGKFAMLPSRAFKSNPLFEQIQSIKLVRPTEAEEEDPLFKVVVDRAGMKLQYTVSKAGQVKAVCRFTKADKFFNKDMLTRILSEPMEITPRNSRSFSASQGGQDDPSPVLHLDIQM